MQKTSKQYYQKLLPGEVNLWTECIIQHYRDLFLKPKKNYKIKLHAKQFLFQQYYNFGMICQLLNNNPDLVSKKIKILYKLTKENRITIIQGSDLLYKLITEAYISSIKQNEHIS